MKILIVSNLYPPHVLGGYEIRCGQVAEALQAVGHSVEVITSHFEGVVRGYPVRRKRREVRNGVVVHRCLEQGIVPHRFRLRPWAYFHALQELADARGFQRVVAAFQPDIINWWSLLGAFKLGLPLPARWGIPDVYWIEQSWLLDQVGPGGSLVAGMWRDFWEGRWGHQRTRWVTRAIGRRMEARAIRSGFETRDFSAAPRHVCFVSEYQARLHQESDVTFPSSGVIHGGVPVEEFLAPVRITNESEPLRLLYAGQITSDRGLLTVVEALGMLSATSRRLVTLRVAGEGHEQQRAYRERIEHAITAMGLSSAVTFLGGIPHSEMPALFRAHDVLVFASERHEGLPLSMVEAMLSGCLVVTTGAGGAGEIASLAGLPTFPPGEAGPLAKLLGDLASDRAKVAQLAAQGQRVARAEFSFEKMMDRFLATLTALTDSPSTGMVRPGRRMVKP